MLQFFENLSLSKKQMFALLAAGLVPLIVISVLSLNISKGEVRDQAFAQLAAVRDIKADAIERHFDVVEKQLQSEAASADIVLSMTKLQSSFHKLEKSDGVLASELDEYREALRDYYQNQFGKEYQNRNDGQSVNIEPLLAGLNNNALIAQYKYIADNDNALGEKHLADAASGVSTYHNHHANIHSSLRTFLEAFGYYDIFLVDTETGDIVYSVFKELDYGTSLIDGPYKDTNFARAFRRAAEMEQGEVAFEDFEPYLPSYEAPASFLASPIYHRGKAIGVLIFQVPLEPVNAIMGERSGMGETGETYLVGKDLLMRSDSYLDPVNHSVSASFKNPEKGKVETDAARLALSGERGEKIVIDYNGNPVLSAFSTVDILGAQWAILAEIDVQEAFAGVRSLQWWVLGLSILIIVGIVAFSFYISRLISNPILALSRDIQNVSKTGCFQQSGKQYARDEVGDTARAFSNLIERLAKAFNETNDVLSALSKGEYDKKVSEAYAGDLGELARGVNVANGKIREASEDQKLQAELAAKSAEEAKEQARKALIIKQALDVSATAAMICDSQFKTVYVNDAAEKLMRASSEALQAENSRFNSDNLIGQDIDLFNTDISQRRDKVQSLDQTFRERLVLGGLTFDLATTPIRDEGKQFLGAVVEWVDRTEELAKLESEKAIANENARIRQALDSSSTATMIADENDCVIYVNDVLQKMFASVSAEIQKQHQGFDVKNVIGQNLSHIYSNVGSQNSNSFSNEFSLGERRCVVTSTPIVTQSGEYSGAVVEWQDKTNEHLVEQDIDALIKAASQGDFSRTLETENRTGFFLRVSEGLNELLQTVGGALSDVVDMFAAMSKGDLSKTIDKEYSGEFARLKDDANAMVKVLQDITEGIHGGASMIARSSQEISVGNIDLSKRTENQAASLEETAASMEQMLATVQASEKNISETNVLAQESMRHAKEGDSSVQQAVSAMKSISESSERIASIISVIDEIAFQTNLLALNAAVEAARAGEHGKGFAVVASEVRNLAQRTADSAKEIKSLINDSVTRVEDGAMLVEKSGETLGSIVAAIEGVAEKMNELLVSGKEQTAGIQQASNAVVYMDQMTQQNAALVEEASAASTSMAEEAQRLSSLVAFFSKN